MITFYIVGAVVFFLSGDSTCTATTTTHRREKKSMKNHRKYHDEQYDELPILDDIVLTDPDLTTLATAFQTANLNGTLCNECNFTVFAPTNDAFASLNQTLLELLLTPSWRMHLVDLLSFHVTFPTVDRQLTKDFKDGQVLDMINGEQITVHKFKRGIELSSPYTPTSSIVKANILASNGALNKIDSVLLPGFFGVNVFALGDAFVDFTTLQELLELDGGKGREGLYTILAPDNGAFASMTDETLMELKNNTIELNFIMENHIIPGVFPSNTLVDGQKLTTLGGRSVTVSITESKISETGRIIRFNGVTAVQSDLLAMNGVAYRFESLVFDPDPASDVPSFVPSDVPSDYPSDIPTSIPSLFDVGEIDPDFTVLDELFDLTGLGDLEGEFTLLAPINDAWFDLGNETLARLQNNIAVLERLLRGHLIAGIYPPSDLINGAVLPTLAGLNVTVPPTVARSLQFVAAQQSSFMFNEATSSDIYYAGNGIIYKIDEVLFDELAITLVPTPTPTSSPIEPDVVETNVPTETPVVEVTPEPDTPAPTVGITDAPTFTPTIALCIDFDCDDGYILVSDAATIPGNDRATCCYFGGICAGAPVGAMCALGDLSSSLVSNPSFEEFSECPNAPEQISMSTGWIEGVEPYFLSSFFAQSPTCNDSWYRNGAVYVEYGNGQYSIGSIPQNAADGNSFVGTSLEDYTYGSYIGTCLDDPLVTGVEHTLTLNVAAPEGDFDYGGDTNGLTDLICIPDCALLPYNSYSFSGSEFEVLATAEPDGGLIGGGDWKAITFNFVSSTNCAAIVIGPNEDQTSQDDVIGSYVLYDFINLQEGAAGMCNAEGACIPVDSSLTFCIDFDCGEGYILFDDAATRQGNDRATCCYRAGVCAGASVGAMCSLGDIGSSLIPNPSFEEFSSCPFSFSQLFYSDTWVQATDGTSDFFIESPTCDDSWYRNGVGGLGSIPQNATDGNAFVGSIKELLFDLTYYYEYIGACLNEPLTVGVEYTFTLDVAAAVDDFSYGGDTNGATDLICIPECGLFPISGDGYKGSDFEILATAEPEGGLVGGGAWKSLTFNFVPGVNCPAIMFGPSANQTIQPLQQGSYIIYDFLNLQEGAAGICNAEGECVPVDSSPTITAGPTAYTSPAPTAPALTTPAPVDSGVPPPPSPTTFEGCSDDDSCDDENSCTIDTCTSDSGCTNIPIECGEREACDLIDGSCKIVDQVRPCIAVIDESNISEEGINARWRSFRTNFPDRPFCLIIPNNPSSNFFLPTDPDFSTDPRAVWEYVARDMGNAVLASNYLDICGYSSLASTGIDFIGLFVDESGSMRRRTVSASLSELFQDLNTNNVTYCAVTDEDEDWISPFNDELGEACDTQSTFNPTVTISPTNSPTITFMPTITAQPSITDTFLDRNSAEVLSDPESMIDVNSTNIGNNEGNTNKTEILETPTATKLTVAPTAKPQSMPKQGPTPEPISATPTKAPIVLNVSVPETPSLKLTSSPMQGTTLTPIDKSRSGPTVVPSPQPVKEPTNTPTVLVTKEPIAEPTAAPTNEPTPEPTPEPTIEPTVEPTAEPTERPESTDQESSP